MTEQLPELLKLLDEATDPHRKCGLAIGIISHLRADNERLTRELRATKFKLRCAQGALTLAEQERDAARRESASRIDALPCPPGVTVMQVVETFFQPKGCERG